MHASQINPATFGIQDAVYRVACILVAKYMYREGYRSSCRTRQGGVSYSLEPMNVVVATVVTMFALQQKKFSLRNYSNTR